MNHHLKSQHEANIGNLLLSSLFSTLQDHDGRRSIASQGPVWLSNYEMKSYNFLSTNGLLNIMRNMVQYQGPFRCDICMEESYFMAKDTCKLYLPFDSLVVDILCVSL